MIFQGIRISIRKKPKRFVIFQGVPTPLPSPFPWIRVWTRATNIVCMSLCISAQSTMFQSCWDAFWFKPGPEVIKLFSYSTQLSTKFILLINVKMPTIVGILTFISMITTTPERLKAIHFFICRYYSFYEQLKFHAQLS